MLQNYEQLIEKIAKASGLEKEEIDRKVEAKCAKLSGLISKEGSAQIVASELGISFDNEKMKISEIVSGMKKVNIVGKIIRLNAVREFVTKNGTPGKVLSMTVADDSGNVRVVLWDTNHIALFEESKIVDGQVVEITNAAVRNDEVHLSGFSDIKSSVEVIEDVQTAMRVVEKKIIDFKPGENVKLRGVVAQVFDPRFFEVCPECSKKVVENKCVTHGTVIGQKRALLSVVLDDGSENMRGVMFSEQINNFGISDEEVNNPELFLKKKEELMGEEMFFSANVRNNKLFNTTELVINNVEKVDVDQLIESLK